MNMEQCRPVHNHPIVFLHVAPAFPLSPAPELIAAEPCAERTGSRLLWMARAAPWRIALFCGVVGWCASDLMVFNNHA
ncbi:MAG: hypothetical protein R3E67_02665 [Pseudomonadales bacterium]